MNADDIQFLLQRQIQLSGDYLEVYIREAYFKVIDTSQIDKQEFIKEAQMNVDMAKEHYEQMGLILDNLYKTEKRYKRKHTCSGEKCKSCAVTSKKIKEIVKARQSSLDHHIFYEMYVTHDTPMVQHKITQAITM